MFGRLRAPSSSLESLEKERDDCFKITKHDSLSIYEATLVKLKQGAQRELTCVTEQEMSLDSYSASDQSREGVMMIDTHFSPSSVLPSSTGCSPLCSSSKEPSSKTMTVVSMFDRYKSSHHALRTPDQAAERD